MYLFAPFLFKMPHSVLGPAGSLIKIVNVENLYADKQLHLLKVLANIMAPHHVRIVREKFFSQNHLDFSGHINYPKGKEEDHRSFINGRCPKVVSQIATIQ